MDIALIFLIMFALMALGLPLGFAIVIPTIICFSLFTTVPLDVVAQNAITGLDSFPMLAIPFFILAGNIMSKGGLAGRLVDAMASFVGHIQGGLSIVMTLASMFFGAISGSSSATVSAIGGSMCPEMQRKGFDPGFCASISCSSSLLGTTIPPSMMMVMYAVITGASVSEMFVATLYPGILLTVALCLICYFISKKNNYPVEPKATWAQRIKVTKEAFWALISPVIIMGGIYSGIFTPTEAAVISCIYSLVVGLFIYKEIKFKDLFDIFLDSMNTTGLVMYCVGFASAFAAYLNLAQVPAQLYNIIVGITDNPILIMLIVNLLVLMVGCVMDNVPALLVLSPLFLPLGLQAGLTPVTFGIIICYNTSMGCNTPPYGCNMYLAANINKTKFEKMLPTLIPMLIAQIAVLFIITYFPQPMEWLVDLVMG